MDKMYIVCTIYLLHASYIHIHIKKGNINTYDTKTYVIDNWEGKSLMYNIL